MYRCIVAIFCAIVSFCYGDNRENLSKNLVEKMSQNKVPGMSIAVIHNGKIDWAQGFGKITNGDNAVAITEETLFQAASISKAITAFGALLLVQQGKITLDEDINLYLRSWKVFENGYAQKEKVTLRRLLSHTAGITISGFSGYEKGTELPSLIDILVGTNPILNSGKIEIFQEPGSSFSYSGGGMTIVQLLIEDVTQEKFSVWMKKNVLIPLGMHVSTFSLTPSGKIAYGHDQEGEKISGNWHLYPEMAAAGLWSTARDLAQFVLYIQSETQKILKKDLVQEMLTKQEPSNTGLGLFLQEDVFQHTGRNFGFIAIMRGLRSKKEGIVIMLNNDGVFDCMEEIIQDVATTYHWKET